MSKSIHRGGPLSGRERDGFVKYLAAYAVPGKQQPFYVVRLNQFLVEAKSSDSDTFTEQEISTLLALFGRREDLRDWQFAQLVDAVRVYLVHCLKLDAAKSRRLGLLERVSSNAAGCPCLHGSGGGGGGGGGVKARRACPPEGSSGVGSPGRRAAAS